ncbi:MAG: hypothetical protein CR974_03925 [Gammaproteobacteria bacterium]|nr:MAG: hypothetical protein CR974_03925 [Gammaproteobacteria bacterium]
MQATGRAAGISSKEIERLAKIATDAANQATPEWQRLSKAISDATNAEQLRKFGEEARQAMSAGKISAEQYKDVLKQVENQQKQLNQAKQEQAEAERQAASAMQASTQAMAQNTQKTRENTEATKENAKTHLEALRRADETETQQLYDSRGLTEAQNERLKRRAEQINRAHAAFPEMGADYSELEKMADRFRRQNQREKTQTTQPQQVELVAQAFEDALAKQRLTQPALDTSTEKKIDKLSETFRKGLQEVEERGAQKGADMAVTKITRGLEQYRKGQGR